MLGMTTELFYERFAFSTGGNHARDARHHSVRSAGRPPSLGKVGSAMEVNTWAAFASVKQALDLAQTAG
jgi:hypothetical protein